MKLLAFDLVIFNVMKKIYPLVLIISLLFLSCSKKAEFAGTGYNRSAVKTAAFTDSKMTTNLYSDMAFESESLAESVKSPSQANEAAYERKLIKDGNISIQVPYLEKAMLSVEEWVKGFGGYISFSNNYNNYCNYTVRIPSSVFDQAMNSLGKLGKVTNRSISVQDVTDRFYDLETRLQTKKILRDKYNEYLKKAENVKDMLEVERQLNNVVSEIESMEGSLKLLNNQIDYSTISINLSTPNVDISPSYSIEGFQWKEIFYNIANFMISFVKVIIYIIIYGIPLLAFIAFLYWLLLGKLGLLKKLFYKLSGKKFAKKIKSSEDEENKNE